ncbi:MAG: hypothetical protein CMP23_08145 [Rickettsiales bacterium]|nr:hypothetical protein [Rickettsiales bacterium]
MSSALAGRRHLVLAHGVRLLVVLLGFSALRMGGELGGLRALAAVLAVGLSCWVGRPRLGQRGWLILQLSFLVWLLFSAFWAQRHMIAVFCELLVFVQVHRLLAHRGPRDDLYLVFIGFGQILIAAVLTIDLLYLLVLSSFLVAVAWLLALAQLSPSSEASASSTGLSPEQLDALLGPRGLFFGAAVGLVLLLGTAALFLVLPRMQAGMLQAGMVSPLHISGFAERVRLGAVGSLKLSAKPVFRARVTDRDGQALEDEGLYWHGLALDRFDGRSWELSEPERVPLSSLAAQTYLGPPQEQPWALRAEVSLEPMDSDVLFHVPLATGLYGLTRLEAASTDGFYIPGRGSGGVGRSSYVVYSDPSQPELETLRDQDPSSAPAALLERYTQLPRPFSPRFNEIAREWTEGATSAVDRALVVQRTLRGDFDYSLDQEASTYDDPLLAFLDEVQEGHCEYFATAMTVLLRSLGIPSRVVNGFYGGEWNPVGEYWLLRQRDAHSWVEVWFPSAGWVIFDPTPAAGTGFGGRARLTIRARIAAIGDYAELLWEELLLDYGLGAQVDGLRAVFARLQAWGGGEGGGASFGALPGRLFSLRAPPSQGAEAAAERPALGLLLVALVLLLFAWRLGWLWRRPPHALLRRLVVLMERDLRHRFREQDSCEPLTALGWARWAEGLEPGRFEGAVQLVERYYAVRFGTARLDPALVRELRRLRSRTRRWRRAPVLEAEGA